MTFLDILDEHGVHYISEGPGTRPGWVQLDCPWCGVPGKPGLGYNTSRNYLHCWKCGSHSLFDVVAKLTGLGYRQTRDILGKLENRVLKQEEKKVGTLKLPKGIGPLRLAHRRYLEGRGLNPDELERLWHVQGIGMATALPWHLFIPVELNGKCVSWTTRTIAENPKGARYHSADEQEEEVPIKKLLYGEDLAQRSICVVEGPADAWRVGPGAVAVCGVSYTQAQVWRMSRYQQVAVCFDTEAYAQKRAAALVADLSLLCSRVYRIQLDAPDPGEASHREVQSIRKTLGL